MSVAWISQMFWLNKWVYFKVKLNIKTCNNCGFVIIFERVILKRLEIFLDCYNVYSDSQNGLGGENLHPQFCMIL